MSYVEGSYPTVQEALLAVRDLKHDGYRKQDIRLISNEAMRDSYMTTSNMNITTKKTMRKSMLCIKKRKTVLCGKK